MTPNLVLPVGKELDGQRIRIVLPERDVSLQREWVPNGQSGAEERWTLIGVWCKFTAQADAAINPDGSAVTGQWRLEDKDFTLVIVQRANDLRGFFLGPHDFVRQYAEEFNISNHAA